MRLIDWTAADGTRLVARLRGPELPSRRPVLCLPGLTRNSRDFDRLADALSSGEAPRTVAAVDYRGRGLSAWADPASYRPDVEATDVLALLDRLGWETPAIVGTSRGGIIAMILAMTAPQRVGPVVLNDIGPVLEAAGLAAIRDRMSETTGRSGPADWTAAAEELRAFLQPRFPALTDEDWAVFSRQVYRENERGDLVVDYDPRLLDNFASLSAEGIPPFWPAFEALAPRPVLAIRGEHSDLLSAATLAEMAARHPGMEIHEVPGQGHAPLLNDAASIERIRTFLDRADERWSKLPPAPAG